jgi:hypothetical protein
MANHDHSESAPVSIYLVQRPWSKPPRTTPVRATAVNKAGRLFNEFQHLQTGVNTVQKARRALSTTRSL